MKKTLAALVIAAASVLSPAIAYADPPADSQDLEYFELVLVTDPITCTVVGHYLTWDRESVDEPWHIADDYVPDDEPGLGSETDCPDWSQDDETGEWSYTPPVEIPVDVPPVDGPPPAGAKVGLVAVWKVGIHG